MKLSFGILDDLEFAYGPIHLELHSLDQLEALIDQIVKGLKCEPKCGEWCYGNCKDVSGYFYSKYYKLHKAEILDDLIKDKYCVWNRFQKYYVIAFAIDYTRFEIYSKDCDKKVIEWGEGQGPIKGVIQNENYNENPVVTLLRNM